MKQLFPSVKPSTVDAGHRPRWRVLAGSLGLTLATTLVTTQALAAATVGFDPQSTTVEQGLTFELVLQGLGFDSTPAGLPINSLLAAQNVNFSFDSARLEVLGIAIDPRWTFVAGNRTGVIDNAAGTVTGLSFGVFPATPDDSFRIATFTLRALAGGVATISPLSGQFIGQVGGLDGRSIAPDLVSASVTVSAVPEPQSWLLLAGGLWGLGLLKRRRAAAR